MSRPSAIAAFVALVTVSAVTALFAAQKPTLALKPGLWKMTNEMSLTPRGRAQMESSPIPLPPGFLDDMTKPSESLQCLTAEDIAAHRLTPKPPPEHQQRLDEIQKCRVKINKSSATEVQLTETCFQKISRTDQITKIKIEAPTPTRLTYTSRPWDPDEGPTLTRRGIWLGASCDEKH